MKKIVIFLLSSIIILSSYSLCVTIDGKFWDWKNVKPFYYCRTRPLERDRSGFDMQSVKMLLGGKFLYMYIEGRSVAGLKVDRGWGAKKTSVRISFDSSQSPLNRVRIAVYPAKPGQIRVSCPHAPTRVYGSKADRWWVLAKYGNKYAFEIKMPFYYSSKGVHIGARGGPLIRLSRNYATSRDQLSGVLINSVDMKTHRLVDTAVFSIRKGRL